MHTNIRRKKGHWQTYSIIPGLGFSTTSVLAVRPQEVWLGTENGIASWDGRRYRIITEREGLPDANVRYLFKDSIGRVWICTTGGIAVEKNGVISAYSERDGIPAGSVPRAAEGPDGSIWAIVSGKGIFRSSGDRFSLLPGSDVLENNHITCVLPEPDGAWIGSSSGLYYWRESGSTDRTEDFALPSASIRDIMKDSSGSLWIGTVRGIVRRTDDGIIAYNKNSGCDITDIRMIAEDREHNIWIGSYRQGTDCYSDGTFVSFRTRDGLASDTVLGMSQEENGTYWFACRFGGFSSFKPWDIDRITDEAVNESFLKDSDGNLWWGTETNLTTLGKDRILRYSYPSSVLEIFEDSRERLWVSTLADGVYMYSSIRSVGRKRPKHFTARDGLTSREIWRIREDRSGRIWMGGAEGVYIYSDRIERHLTVKDGLASQFISSICEDSTGNVWLGGWQGGGLSVCMDGDVRPFDGNHLLPGDAVIDMYAENDGTIWVGTVAGIFRVRNGRLLQDFPNHDLLSRRIQRFRKGRDGRMYIATLGGGLIKYDGNNFQILTAADRLPSDCVTGWVENEDGSFYISTYRGIIRYSPDYAHAPIMKIDELVADRSYRNPSDVTVSGCDIPITVRYHGACTLSSRMRYSYILEGYDESWTSTWNEEVRFENLPEGSYTFRIRTFNKDLVPSEFAEVRFSLMMGTHDRIITDLKETVAERTRELEGALHRLEQLNYHLRMMSLQDELSGLYNRRGFLTLGRQHFKHAARTQESFLVCFADLDGLKKINDTYGHDEGDEAIRKAAEVLRYTFRDEDIIARLGGDEFTVLVSGASTEDFTSIRERLERYLRKYNSHSGKPYSLGMSIGAAPFVPGRTASLEELMTEADAVLYGEKQAKKSAIPGSGV